MKYFSCDSDDSIYYDAVNNPSPMGTAAKSASKSTQQTRPSSIYAAAKSANPSASTMHIDVAANTKSSLSLSSSTITVNDNSQGHDENQRLNSSRERQRLSSTPTATTGRCQGGKENSTRTPNVGGPSVSVSSVAKLAPAPSTKAATTTQHHRSTSSIAARPSTATTRRPLQKRQET
mmetsp:Transcript_19046/g.46010  ORF Transcript_19046/g.46010 Transcript_19046/m.46010 type:complete len:177 (-) Transcript_19046:1081-1611(-)